MKNGYVTCGDYSQHRLLALTFLPVPDLTVVNTLDVNHKDGIKYNNEISNLEWATRSDNCRHAYTTGLRTDNVEVLSKNIRTGEVKEYYSMQECARAFETNAGYISRYLEPKNKGRVFFEDYIFIHKGDEWPTDDEIIDEGFKSGVAIPVSLTSVETGEEIIYEARGDAANFLGVKTNTLAMFMHRNKNRPYKGYFIKQLHRLTPEQKAVMIIQDRSWERTPRKPIPITVYDRRTNETTHWESVEKFAESQGVVKNTVQAVAGRNNGWWRSFEIKYDSLTNESPLCE